MAFLPPISSIDACAIEQVLKDFQNEGGVLQGSLLIAHRKQVIISKGFGVADALLDKTNTVGTQFLIGSITKQFTAAAVLKSLYDREIRLHPQLNEDAASEKIKTLLSRPLSDYLLPQDPIWEGKAPGWLELVTPHHLLCHASGIPNYTNDPSFHEFSQIDHNSLSRVVSLFKEKDLEFAPGSQWNYSNSGYILLGLLVERVSGIGIEKYFEENLWNPLHMESTFMPSAGCVRSLKQGRPDFARGYAWDMVDSHKPLQEQPMYENMLCAYAAGAMISTVEDLHRWNVALYEEESVLPKCVKDLMLAKHMPMDSQQLHSFYAYGVNIEDNPELSVYGHAGLIPGYFSVLHYYPRSHTSLIVLHNVTANVQQQMDLQQELEAKFGHLEQNQDRWDLEEAYIKQQYGAISEQSKTHDFAKPLVDFLEHTWK